MRKELSPSKSTLPSPLRSTSCKISSTSWAISCSPSRAVTAWRSSAPLIAPSPSWSNFKRRNNVRAWLCDYTHNSNFFSYFPVSIFHPYSQILLIPKPYFQSCSQCCCCTSPYLLPKLPGMLHWLWSSPYELTAALE